jgi:hypothetical protein
MPEAKNGNPGPFLDLLLDYFADDARWTQGDLDDGHGDDVLSALFIICGANIKS